MSSSHRIKQKRGKQSFEVEDISLPPLFTSPSNRSYGHKGMSSGKEIIGKLNQP